MIAAYKEFNAENPDGVITKEEFLLTMKVLDLTELGLDALKVLASTPPHPVLIVKLVKSFVSREHCITLRCNKKEVFIQCCASVPVYLKSCNHAIMKDKDK